MAIDRVMDFMVDDFMYILRVSYGIDVDCVHLFDSYYCSKIIKGISRHFRILFSIKIRTISGLSENVLKIFFSFLVSQKPFIL